jgi:two-component system, sensor histidine kinase YesM
MNISFEKFRVLKKIVFPGHGLTIRTRIFMFFILLNLVSFTILYLLVNRSYYQATLRQTQFISNEVLTSLETNLDFIINEILTLSLDVYANKRLNELAVDYYQTSYQTYVFEYEIKNSLKQFLNTREYIKSIRLYIKDTCFYTVQNTHLLVDDTFPASDLYQKAFAADGKLVCIPTYNQTYSLSMYDYYQQKIISFARAVKNLRQIYKNEKIGILVIDFDEKYLRNLFNRLNLSQNHFLIICSGDGQILSASNEKLIGSNVFKRKFLSNGLNRKRGDFFSYIGNDKYFITYNTFPKLNWKIICFIPTKDLFLQSNTFSQTILSFTLLLVIANLFLSFMLTKVIVNPIQKLISTINRIGTGDFSSRISITNHDEIGAIGVQFNKMVDNIETLLKENYIIRLKEKEAQIKSLQAQVNPHFLYNTLDTISWKIMLLGDKNTNKIIIALGEILRYSIDSSGRLVNLEQDLQQVKNYLYIQQMRYEDRFTVYFRVDPATLHLKVNKLLIQPIVENAILHGLENKEQGGILCISSTVKDEKLRIVVFDNGCGIPKELIHSILDQDFHHPDNSKQHIGMNNVHQRIQLYYGNLYGIEIKSRENKYTKVVLILPLLREA